MEIGTVKSSDYNSFYRFMTDIQDDKLIVPYEFVARRYNEIPLYIKLKCGSNQEFVVKLVRDAGQFVFEEGWSKICEIWRIQVQELVVFNFESTTMLSVNIFSTNCIERSTLVTVEDTLCGTPERVGGKESYCQCSFQQLTRPASSDYVWGKAYETPSLNAYLFAERHNAIYWAVVVKDNSALTVDDQFVPMEWLSRRFKCGVHQIVIRTECGKEWPVICEMGPFAALVTTGWNSMMKDLSLAAGDEVYICMSPENSNLWNLTICGNHYAALPEDV